MSYVSLLKNIPDFLSQPAGIAVIASVGIHGVIAFMLPLMPMETKTTKEVKNSKTVGLVELNQSDRQRLPQTNSAKTTPNSPEENLQAQVSLPEFATKTTPLPTLQSPPFSSNPDVMPPLPTSLGGELKIDPSPQRIRINNNPQTTNSNSFRIRPTDRFGARPSLSTDVRQTLAFKDPVPANPNPRSTEISRSEIGSPINTRNNTNTHRSNIRTSNLPNLNPAPLPSGLPNNPVQTARANTSIPGLPNSEISRNSSGKLEVTGNTSNSTENQQLATAVGDPKAIDRLGSTKDFQVSNNKVNSRNKVITEPQLFAKVKQQTPNIEIQAEPLQPTLDLPQGGKATNVKGALVVDGEGKIDFFELLDKSISSDLKVAVREHFKKYFQNNPVKANGKPKYFSFNVAFGSTSNQPSSLGSQSIRERLGAIRDSRQLKSNPSPGSGATTNEKSSSPSPVRLSIQSVIGSDSKGWSGSSTVPGNTPRRDQKPSSGVLSQRLRSVVINSQDNSGDNNQASSSSQEKQKNLIERLREVREERKASDSR